MKLLLQNSGAGEAAFNMALDEALLEAMPELASPVLRFYGWTVPSSSFGYFQKYSEVEQATRLRPIVRRPTGGGVVPHIADWTYSLTFPFGHEWYSLSAEESYRRVHEWIRCSFTKLGVETELASCCKKSVIGQCFVGHEKSDLLWRGKKIAGAAQRRNKLGLLIQGSVQSPVVGLNRADWERAMVQSQPGEWAAFLIPAELAARAEVLVREKYSQTSYNQRR